MDLIVRLGQVEQSLTESTVSFRQLESPVCSRRMSFQHFSHQWRNQKHQLSIELMGLRGTLNQLRQNAVKAQSDAGLLKQTAKNAAEIARAEQLTERADSVIARIERGATKISTLSARLTALEQELNALDGASTTRTTTYLPASTESVELSITATERRPPQGNTAAVIQDPVDLPVREGLRVFLSVGVLASHFSPHDYERRTQLRESASGDSLEAYQTFVNRTPTQEMAFAPVFQVNAAMPDRLGTGITPHVSVGVASRALTDSDKGVDFLVGGGIGILDSMLFTVGLHMGRDEVLLLGDDELIRERPTPSISDAEAVGMRWKVAPTITATFKLND